MSFFNHIYRIPADYHEITQNSLSWSKFLKSSRSKAINSLSFQGEKKIYNFFLLLIYFIFNDFFFFSKSSYKGSIPKIINLLQRGEKIRFHLQNRLRFLFSSFYWLISLYFFGYGMPWWVKFDKERCGFLPQTFWHRQQHSLFLVARD